MILSSMSDIQEMYYVTIKAYFVLKKSWESNSSLLQLSTEAILNILMTFDI